MLRSLWNVDSHECSHVMILGVKPRALVLAVPGALANWAKSAPFNVNFCKIIHLICFTLPKHNHKIFIFYFNKKKLLAVDVIKNEKGRFYIHPIDISEKMWENMKAKPAC